MTIDHQEAEKNAKALLKFALGNHNAKRYQEAAGFYEVILKQYPDTEAAKYAQTNLSSLVNKIDGLEAIWPDKILIARIEQQSISSEPTQNLDPPLHKRERPIYQAKKTSKPEAVQVPVKNTEPPLRALKPNYPLNACVCANCGYVGKPKTVTRGSIFIEIILWLTFLIPRLIYSIWRLTTRHKSCPQFFAPNMVPLDSPRGRKLVEEYGIKLYS